MRSLCLACRYCRSQPRIPLRRRSQGLEPASPSLPLRSGFRRSDTAVTKQELTRLGQRFVGLGRCLACWGGGTVLLTDATVFSADDVRDAGASEQPAVRIPATSTTMTKRRTAHSRSRWGSWCLYSAAGRQSLVSAQMTYRLALLPGPLSEALGLRRYAEGAVVRALPVPDVRVRGRASPGDSEIRSTGLLELIIDDLSGDRTGLVGDTLLLIIV